MTTSQFELMQSELLAIELRVDKAEAERDRLRAAIAALREADKGLSPAYQHLEYLKRLAAVYELAGV